MDGEKKEGCERRNEELEQEQESSDTSESEDLHNLILEHLTSMEPSDISDEENYQVRLSCILEDDESESSASQGRSRDFPKNEAAGEKMGERDKTSEESDSSGLTMLRDKYGEVQVTDLDELSVDSTSEKTETLLKTEEEGSEAEETDEDEEQLVPFGIVKLKSSENVLEKKIMPKRTEFSSDSSDIDISISNEKPGDVNAIGNGQCMDVENPLFEKVSKKCVEKAKSQGSKEEDERKSSRTGSVEREVELRQEEQTADRMILQVVHLRSKSPRVYTPPIPPETYLWEELKRIRGKGGYPWTYLDKPPFDEAAWKKYMEHEYEPINPPPLSALRRKDEDQNVAGESKNDSVIPETERKPREEKKIKKKEENIQPVTATPIEAAATAAAEDVNADEDMEVENIAVAQDLQDEMEGRYFAQTPTTTASRTDGDVNTSMLDSSGLEDIPLKRTARSKIRAHGIQQRLRNQAGKIRSKFRSLPKPSLTARERTNGEEKHRFKLPDRPKFNFSEKLTLPERPKFKLPERPKIHLPERPKLHLPERPKLHLPERPKLHLPERPKLHLPERPKLHLPERPKLHLPERPKFNLPEMSKFHLPERPKLHLPERPKVNLPSFVRPLRERQETSPRKNIFELDLKSYPKIFAKKSRREYATSSPKKIRESTPPPKMRSEEPRAPERKKVPVGQRWLKKMDDIKYADDDAKDEHSESLGDLGAYMEDLDDSRYPPGGRKTLSTKSSLSDRESISSEGKHRKGVLEEINSDEFFLRQKGISQEDIDMGKYLSHEIREAFRSPEVNALARMDYDYDEESPQRPTRTRSLKKTFESEHSLNENSGYKTYPPRRPNRKSRSHSKSLVNEEAIIEGPMYENQYQEDVSEYYKAPRDYEHYQVPRPITDTMPPAPYKRKKTRNKKFEDIVGMETSVEGIDQTPPQPMVRRKSKRSLDRKQESIDEDIQRVEYEEKFREHEYIIPDEVPVPPRRTRSLTQSFRSSRSLRSEADDSRDVEAAIETQSLTQVEIKPYYEEDPGFGYATIGKPSATREMEKQERPPPRKKRDVTMFNTVPRRTPIRPMRNYSTLGPARPPRKNKLRSIDRLSQAYMEIENECKDLKKEEVIEKMKGRPLPPPPRPPRQKSKGPEEYPEEETEEEKLAMALLKGSTPEPVVESQIVPQQMQPVEEVCASTQTDPVPDDFLIEVEDDIIQEFSHEQLKIQQAFLEEMKKEEEAERLPEPFDADLGYSSLDRRHKQEPEPSTSAGKLDVKELEVERLKVRELETGGLTVSHLHAGQLTADDITTKSGNLTVGNVDLPPGFIQQIVEKIPWEELRPEPVRSVEEVSLPRRHRQPRRISSSTDEERPRQRQRSRPNNQDIAELSNQLARACAASGVRAMQSIASRIQNTQIEDKALLMRAILCIIVILVAGFLLLGGDKQTVLHHHWDFQFPPQPPPRQP